MTLLEETDISVENKKHKILNATNAFKNIIPNILISEQTHSLALNFNI